MLKPVGRGSVVDIVVDQIKNLILSEKLKPGDKIPTEIVLMEQLNVGRNSVREAIKMLTALGILEVRRGQGTFVAKEIKPSYFDPLIFSMMIEPKTNKDIYEFRLMYDTMVGITAMKNSTPSDLEALKANLDEVEKAYAEGKYLDEPSFYAGMDMAFHRLLLEATHNPMIIRLGDTIIEIFQRYIEKSIQQDGGIKRSIRNHKNILLSLSDNDATHVIAEIDRTLEEWKNNWNEIT